jgi:iron(III) transport system ATP-binding protein
MRSEIRRICKKHGLTAVYVTHDQKEALSMGDRLAIMEKGNLAQVGTPQEIYREPKSLSVANFIGETNALPGEILNETSRPGIWAVSTAQGTWWGRVADAAYRPQAGDFVQLVMRPEAMNFIGESKKTNTLTGHLHESIYLGDLAQYVLRDDRGRLFRLTESNPVGLHPDLPQTVHFTAEPWDVMILRR